MQEVFKLIIGVLALFLAIPIGNLLARLTKEELKPGRIYFKTIILISSIGAIIALIFRNDFLLFTFLFIIITTLVSLRKS